jgi:hypothetical protein
MRLVRAAHPSRRRASARLLRMTAVGAVEMLAMFNFDRLGI